MTGAPPRPTDADDRALAIDALRGFALAGIAIVNVPWIGFRESIPALLWTDSLREALSPIDLGAAVFIEGLCEGRFYPIFSALFGLGSGILFARGLAVYARRIAALLVFGVLHATFGWYGDVLINYAAAGLVLACFSDLRPRTLLTLSGVLLGITMLASWRFDDWFGPRTPEELAAHLEAVDREMRVYRDGSFETITLHRLNELRGYFTAEWNVSYRINVLAMATLGLAIERAGIVARLSELRPRIGRLALVLVVAGLVLSGSLWVVPQLYLLAGDVLAGGYALAFVWWVTGARAPRWAAPFAAVGRTALTCYLLQTVCFTFFFYGYGLRRYGELGPAAGVALALGVYAAELALASAWLRVFEHGPLELVWRGLTYLRMPSIFRAKSGARVLG